MDELSRDLGVFDSQPRDASLMGEFLVASKPLYPIRPEPWYENLVLGANTRCGWTVGDHGIPMGRACWVVQVAMRARFLTTWGPDRAGAVDA